MPVVSEQILSDICESRPKKCWDGNRLLKMIQASGLKEFVSHYWTYTKLQYGRLFYNCCRLC